MLLGRQVVSMEQVNAVAPSETLAQDSEEQPVGEQSEVILLHVRSKDQWQSSSRLTPKPPSLLGLLYSP